MRWTIDPYRHASSGSEPDPYYNNVILLLDPQASDGGSWLVDHSPVGRSMSIVGTAAVNTTTVPYAGAASIYIPDTSSGIEIDSFDSDFNFDTTTPFTIEARQRIETDLGTIQAIMSLWTHSSSTTRAWMFGFDTNSSHMDFRLYVQRASTSFQATIFDAGGTAEELSTWKAVAVTFDGTTYRGYVEGIMVASGTYTDIRQVTTTQLRIGRTATDAVNPLGQGYISSIRYTRGVARYTGASYTVSNAPFARSAP